MQTLLEVLQKSEAFLKKKGVGRSKLDAELLISDALGMKRLDMFMQYDRPLGESQLEGLRERIKRRANREPVQYILGHTPFMDLDLLTDKRALIPRPETEELVERIVRHRGDGKTERILDLGTGTGALALALAQAYPDAKVLAVDFSEEALSLARENAQRNKISTVVFQKSHWFDAVDGAFDLIVSNPPYLMESEWASAEPEVREYEPRSALVADEDGAADLIKIIKAGEERLSPSGIMALEMGIAHADKLLGCAQNAGYSEAWCENDLSGRPRYCFLKQAGA